MMGPEIRCFIICLYNVSLSGMIRIIVVGAVQNLSVLSKIRFVFQWEDKSHIIGEIQQRFLQNFGSVLTRG